MAGKQKSKLKPLSSHAGLVTLMSGGIDSAVMSFLAMQDGLEVWPLFVDYGQRSRHREWRACQKLCKKLHLRTPEKADISGYGKLIPSGLTRKNLDVFEDAFLPGRNLMFVLLAASYGYSMGIRNVGIGLLDEKASIFNDQTRRFMDSAQLIVGNALNADICVITPLINLSKKQVMAIAEANGIVGTYSCHSGTSVPCGHCVSCKEIIAAEG